MSKTPIVHLPLPQPPQRILIDVTALALDLWTALFPTVGVQEFEAAITDRGVEVIWQFLIAETRRMICTPDHAGPVEAGRCVHCGHAIDVAREFAKIATAAIREDGASEVRVSLDKKTFGL